MWSEVIPLHPVDGFEEQRICKGVQLSASMQWTRPSHETEKLLYMWMEDQISKLVLLWRMLEEYFWLKEIAGEDYSQESVAINGWFNRFKNNSKYWCCVERK